MTNPVVYFLSIELLNHRSFIFALSHFFHYRVDRKLDFSRGLKILDIFRESKLVLFESSRPTFDRL